MDEFTGKRVCVVYGEADRELVGVITAVNLERQKLTLANVTERGIPQGDMLSLNASKIKDLQLTQDAAPSDGRRRNGRGRVPREQQKRNKEAFGSTGGADDESFSEDFDFAGNNAKFNKDEVFAQFKIDDGVPESERLVSHNLRTRKPEPKIPIHEMVLAPDQPATEEGEAYSVSPSAAGGVGSGMWVTDAGSLLTTVSDEAHRQMLDDAADAGLGWDRIVEAAGASACELFMHLLGNEHNGPTRKRKPPVAVFVIGTSPMGELALCAARRLATRNVRVIAYVPSEHVPGVAEQLKLFALCGRYFKEWRDEGDNEVVYAHCSEPPDLVVEALDGCGKAVEGDTGITASGITASVVDWLNAVNAPRVSFGQAAGVDPISGVLKKDFVRSTVCCQFGLPTMRRQLLNTCQVCVLDIGIPWAVLATAQPPERVGRPFPSPFFTRPFAFIRPT